MVARMEMKLGTHRVLYYTVYMIICKVQLISSGTFFFTSQTGMHGDELIIYKNVSSPRHVFVNVSQALFIPKLGHGKKHIIRLDACKGRFPPFKEYYLKMRGHM